MPLYELEESLRQQLVVENFEPGDFSAKQFVEGLTNSQNYALENGDFDPKPYIRTFEAVAGELEALLEKTTTNENKLQQRYDDTRASHNYNIIDMAVNTDLAVADLKELEDEVAQITRATSIVSSRLERLSDEHRQITSGRELLQYYCAFYNKGASPELDKLWASGDTADRRRCAQAVGHLQVLARKIAPEVDRKTVEDDIDKYAEQLETQLVEAFQAAYAAFDLMGMKEIADILFDFNGGASVVQSFVNQHSFFMQIDKLEDESAALDNTMWEKLSNPHSTYEDFTEVVRRITAEVVDMVTTETDIIGKVFPDPVQVLNVFMQRLFAQRMQGLITVLTSEAEAHSPLALARVVYVCHNEIYDMVKTLKDAWARVEMGADTELAAMLETNLTDSFTLFIGDDYFVATEIPLIRGILRTLLADFIDHRRSNLSGTSNLLGRSESILSRFTSDERDRWNTDTQGVPGSREGSAAAEDLPGSARGSPSLDNDDITASPRLKMGFARSNSVRSNHDDGPQLDDTRAPPAFDSFVKAARDKAGLHALLRRYKERSSKHNLPRDEHVLIQTSKIQDALWVASEAVRREQALRQSQNTARDISVLFHLLLEEICEKYICASLDDAVQQSHQDTKKPINWSYLDSVRRASLATNLLAAFCKTALLTIVKPFVPVHAELSKALNTSVNNVQDLSSHVVDQALACAATRIKWIFSKQKKREFSPRGGELIAEVGDGPTAACAQILQLLSDLETQVRASLHGANIQQFLTELALCLYESLMQHIRRQTINCEGGQALSNDCEAYEYTIVTQFGLTDLAPNFSRLRAIVKLFTAESREVHSLTQDGELSKLKYTTLKEFVSLRADYGTSRSQLNFFHRLNF